MADPVLTQSSSDLNGKTLMTTQLYSGMRLLAQLTASSSASLDFTTRNYGDHSGAIFQSDFNEYEVVFDHVIPASNGASAYTLVSTDGGSTWDTTAIYNITQNYAFTTTVGAFTSNSQAQWTMAANVSNDSHYGICGTFLFSDPLSTSTYKGFLGQFQNFDSSSSTNIINRISSWYLSTTAVNAFQFKFSTGNIASGSIRVYGFAK